MLLQKSYKKVHPVLLIKDPKKFFEKRQHSNSKRVNILALAVTIQHNMMKCVPLSELSPTLSALCWFSFIWHHRTLSKHINGNLSKTAAPERKVGFFFRAMWATSRKRGKLWGRQSVLAKTGMLKRLPIIEIIFHRGGSVLLPFEAPWALMLPLIIPQASSSQSQRSCSQQIRLQTRRSGPQSKHRHTRIMQSRFLSNACHSFCSLRGISFIWSWWSAFFSPLSFFYS